MAPSRTRMNCFTMGDRSQPMRCSRRVGKQVRKRSANSGRDSRNCASASPMPSGATESAPYGLSVAPGDG